MKFFKSALLIGLALEGTVASSWFSKSVYNKWHETELERWLSDHSIPYPKAADRTELEKLVKANWNDNVAAPYKNWNQDQISAYLSDKGYDAKATAQDTKESLYEKIKSSWYETEDKAEDAYSDVKDWIFDTWTDSQLKSFCDKHGIPVPQPRKRDTILQSIRKNFHDVATKAGHTVAYPGDWIYENWSDSDIKAWFDARGIPVPQPAKRDQLIAQMRRNARSAGLAYSSSAAAAQATAKTTIESLGDAVFDSWSDSQIKEWADKNGLKVPQGSKRNELLAFARKHRARLTGDNASASASSAYGAATSKVGSAYSTATDTVFDTAINAWSDTRLKAYLDSRGVPVPQNGKSDELRALARKHSHKASTGYTAWTFDTWTSENLKNWLNSQAEASGKKAQDYSKTSRDQLVKSAQSGYASASSASGTAYASMTSALASATDVAKDTTFDTWTDSDLKSYLDQYGVPVYQGTKSNELKAMAKRQYTYFKYGSSSPTGTIVAQLQNTFNWLYDQVKVGLAGGKKVVDKKTEVAGDYAKEQYTEAKDRAYEGGQRAYDKVKEEL